MTAKICVVTAGHLSTCPRMLKAADTLVKAGYQVRVVSTRFIAWASTADTEIRQLGNGLWDRKRVDYQRLNAPGTYFKSGIRFHAARKLSSIVSPSRCPLFLVVRANGRVYTESKWLSKQLPSLCGQIIVIAQKPK